jgi:hypothetical protein
LWFFNDTVTFECALQPTVHDLIFNIIRASLLTGIAQSVAMFRVRLLIWAETYVSLVLIHGVVRGLRWPERESGHPPLRVQELIVWLFFSFLFSRNFVHNLLDR